MKYILLAFLLWLPCNVLFGQAPPDLSSMHGSHFCVGDSIWVTGYDFYSVDSGHTHDSTVVFVGGAKWMEFNHVISSGNNSLDSILIAPPTGPNYTINAPLDTFSLKVKKSFSNNTTESTISSLGDSIYIHNPEETLIYSDSAYCYGDTIPPPGNSGGIFFSHDLPGIDPVWGSIPLLGVSPGNDFEISYLTNHPHCPDTLTSSLDVKPEPTYSIAHNGQTSSSHCPPVVLLPDTGHSGLFSCNNLALDSLTGEMNIGVGDTGQYVVAYTDSSGCGTASYDTITILPLATAIIAYPQDSVCTGGALLTPNFVLGDTGGTFLSGPLPGLTMDLLGRIDLDNSNAGSYDIDYITVGPCPDTVDVIDLVLIAETDPYFTLTDTTYCEGDSMATVDSIAEPNGVFHLLDGLGSVLASPSTNLIPIATLSPGNYSLERVTSGFCRDTLALGFTILAEDTTRFDYTDSVYCNSLSAISPTMLGGGGGIFSSSGLGSNMNDTSGVIGLDSMMGGSFGVQFVTNGVCPLTTTDSIEIIGLENPAFTYGNTSFCLWSGIDSIQATVATVGGVFSVDTAGLALDTLGTIDLAQSSPGIYQISYSFHCNIESSLTLELVSTDTAIAINLPVDTFCQGRGTQQLQITYSNSHSPPPGTWQLQDENGGFINNGGSFNSSDGTIWLDSLAVGAYHVQYVLDGCGTDPLDTFNVDSPPHLSLEYNLESLCAGDTNQAPIVNQGGGIFWTVPADLVLGRETGIIDVGNSPVGNYDVWYASTGFCKDSASASFKIHPLPGNMVLDVFPGTVLCAGTEATGNLTGDTTVAWGFLLNNSSLNSSGSYLNGFFPEHGDHLMAWAKTSHGCSDTLFRTFTVNPIPGVLPVDDNNNRPLIGGNPVLYDLISEVSNTNVTWMFTMGDSTLDAGVLWNLDAGDFSIELPGTGSGIYTATGASLTLVPEALGCVGDTLERSFFLISDSLDILIPEVFTPNGDGFNDFWEIGLGAGIDPNDFALLVFNRSRGQVARLSPLHSNWTGENLPDGVYVWVLLDKNQTPIRKGGLTLKTK